MSGKEYPWYTAAVSVGLVFVLMTITYAVILLITKIRKRFIYHQIMESLSQRRLQMDTFRRDFGYSWDYIMVFKVYADDQVLSQEQHLFSMRKILTLLGSGGLEVRLYYSSSHGEIYCKIRAALSRLKMEASRIKYPLKCDPVELRSLCEKGKIGIWDPLKIPDHSEDTHLAPYDFMYFYYLIDETTKDTKPELANLYQLYPSLVYYTAESDEQDALEAAQKTKDRTIRYYGKLKPLNDHPELARQYEIAKSNLGNNDDARNRRKSVSEIEMGDIYGGDKSNENFMQTKNENISDDISLQKKFIYQRRGSTAQTLDKNLEREPSVHYSIFRSSDRLKLIYSILTSNSQGCCQLNISQLMNDDCLVDFFALHDDVDIRFVEERVMRPFSMTWSDSRTVNKDIDRVKDYYGEELGYYFEFSNYLSKCLISVAILGVGTWAHIIASRNDTEAVSVPIFAAILAFWSALFFEFWKRRETIINLRWGMGISWDEEETIRAEFTGDIQLSPVTGKAYAYIPFWTSFKTKAISYSILFLACCCVVVVVLSIFLFRIFMQNFTIYGYEIANVVSTMLIAIQIEVCQEMFNNFCRKLISFENHRTDSEHKASYTTKTFIFSLFNAFTSLFYIAFLKPFNLYESCSDESCLLELQYTVGTLILFKMTISNVLELIAPIIKLYIVTLIHEKLLRRGDKKKKDDKTTTRVDGFSSVLKDDVSQSIAIDLLDTRGDVSDAERAAGFYHFSSIDLLDDYNENVVLFGYITMFISSFPLATFLGCLALLIEQKVDFWKLAHVHKRPLPKSSDGIGIYLTILEIISFIAIFTNAGLITYSGVKFINYSWAERAWVFLGISGGLLLIRLFVMFILPDEPGWVNIQKQRKEFIKSKVLYNVEDETDDFSPANFVLPANYSVGKGTEEFE